MKVNPMVFLLVAIFIVTVFGCSDIRTPSAEYAITHPLSTKTMVSKGTSQDEVIETWGDPSKVIEMGYDDLGLKKEAWVYDAWFEKAPLDYRHFSRKKKIYFVGGYVIGYEDIEDEAAEPGE
ncbi:MAG: hypothetical protein ABH848_02720 [Candidatus Omnitrophota bacterium]